MPNARRPSGPSSAHHEERDAATTREELDELAAERAPEAAPDGAQAAENARHAERNARTEGDDRGGRGSS